MKRLVGIAVAVAVLSPALAFGHAGFTPPFVRAGEETPVSIEVPNERADHDVVEVAVSFPAGIEIVSAESPSGWVLTVAGSNATWRGGRIAGAGTVAFRVRLVANGSAGTYAVGTSQVFDDAETVSWESDLSVLPAVGAAAPKQHPWVAAAAALAGVVLIGGSLFALRARRRRRSLQDS